ncbi:hypothetical protein CR513_17443, partial [Mucuna pruriens]
MCYVSASPDQRTTTDLVFLRRTDDDGSEHDRRHKRWSINGQDASRNKTVDFKHGEGLIDRVDVISEATRCRPTLAKYIRKTLIWQSVVSESTISKAAILELLTIWKAIIPTESESRAVFGLKIRIQAGHADFELVQGTKPHFNNNNKNNCHHKMIHRPEKSGCHFNKI